jgi:hypothetical protein
MLLPTDIVTNAANPEKQADAIRFFKKEQVSLSADIFSIQILTCEQIRVRFRARYPNEALCVCDGRLYK